MPESQDGPLPSSVYDSMMHIDYSYKQEKMPDRKISYYGPLNAITKSKIDLCCGWRIQLLYEGQIIDHMHKLQDEI